MSAPTPVDAGLARPSASSGSITLHETDDKASTLVQPRDKSSMRRWYNMVRRIVSSNGAQKYSESPPSRKKSEDSLIQNFPSFGSSNVVVAPYGPPKEDLTATEPTTMAEPAAVLKHVARNQQASSITKVASATAPEPETAAPLIFPEHIKVNGNETVSAKLPKTRRSRKPSGPKMITPAMLDRIAKDNKKRQSASFVREVDGRRTGMGAASSTPRSKGVQASPMRWSQD